MTSKLVKPTHELVDLSISEGSLVDKGDNPEAHVMFFKMKDSEKDGVKPSMRVKLKTWVTEATEKIKDIGSAIDDFEKEEEEIAQNLDKSRDNVSVRPVIAEPMIAKKTDAVNSESAQAGGAAVKQKATKSEDKKVDEKLTFDGVMEGLSDDQRAVVTAKLEEAPPVEATPEPTPEPEDTAKAEAVAKEMSDLREQVQKLQDEKENSVNVAKATEIAGEAGIDIAKLANVLKIAKSAGIADDLEAIVCGLVAQVEKADTLFKTVGSSAGTDAASPEGKLEAAAKALMVAEPGLTYPTAFVKAMESHPELAREVA